MHKLCHLQVVITALATFLVRAAYWYFASNGNFKSLVLKGKNIFRKERENMRMFYRGQCYCFGMQCNQTWEELLSLSIRIEVFLSFEVPVFHSVIPIQYTQA